MDCFKTIIAVFLIIASALSSAEAALNSEDQTNKKMAEEIRAKAKNMEMPVNKHQHDADIAAKKMLAELATRHSDISGIPEKKAKISSHTLIFASFSLGEDGILDLFQTASETSDAVVVFRGITNEKDFSGSIMRIQNLAARQSPVARVIIDPTIFKEYGVSVVPTIVELDRSDRSEIARVSGMSTTRWIRGKISVGRTGDLGVRGDVEEILERDLVDVMKDKIAKIDWAKKKEESIKRFWKNQQYLELRVARKNVVKEVDPTVILSSDLKDAYGKVLVAEGTKINPLDKTEFTQAVVVFDATDSRQVEIVDSKIHELSKTHHKITLISTQFSRDDGWNFYKGVSNRFDKAIYKLTPEIVNRFELEFVPSIITADSKMFYIEEVAVTGVNEENDQ